MQQRGGLEQRVLNIKLYLCSMFVFDTIFTFPEERSLNIYMGNVGT